MSLDPDQKISAHFQLWELTSSDTARIEGIANIPDAAAIANLGLVATRILEPVRERFGAFGFPQGIDSGFRSGALNDRVGGVKNSQHRLGQAVDLNLRHNGVSVLALAEWIAANLKFDQCILEHTSAVLNAGWVHVSVAGADRVTTAAPPGRMQRLTITTSGLTFPGFVLPKAA